MNEKCSFCHKEIIPSNTEWRAFDPLRGCVVNVCETCGKRAEGEVTKSKSAPHICIDDLIGHSPLPNEPGFDAEKNRREVEEFIANYRKPSETSSI